VCCGRYGPRKRGTTLADAFRMSRDGLLRGTSSDTLDPNREPCEFDAEETPTGRSGEQRRYRPSFESEACVVIRQAEDVLLARRAAELLCINLLGEGRRRELALHAISELGANILEHAGDGTIALASIRGPRTGLEIFAHDRGPGIPDVQRLLVPKRIWSLVPEPGLRGIKRLAHEFDIDTSPRGTHVRVVVYR